MPVVKDAVKNNRSGAKRLETNNKVELSPKNGTARFIIEEIWIFDCDERGKFTRHAAGCKDKCADGCPVTGQKSRWVLRLKKRPEILLENRQLCGLGPKSLFQKRIGLLTGTEPGSDECRSVNTDDLVGREVLATYALGEKGYTDITAIMPLEDEDSPAEPQPRATAEAPAPSGPAMITPRQQAEIDALLSRAYAKGWTPDTVKKNCLRLSNGAAEETSKLTAVQADQFFTGLRRMLFRAAEAGK